MASCLTSLLNLSGFSCFSSLPISEDNLFFSTSLVILAISHVPSFLLANLPYLISSLVLYPESNNLVVNSEAKVGL
jgi:hypothetical protein